jgi:hypothetical protein
MTQEQLAKIKWLNRAFHADNLTQALKAKMELDRSLAERITRGYGSDGGHGSSANSTEEALVRLAVSREKLQRSLHRLVLLREEIYAAICTVPDQELRTILIRRYLSYETMERIAEHMHYEKRTVQRKHKKALDQVVIVCHPEM